MVHWREFSNQPRSSLGSTHACLWGYYVRDHAAGGGLDLAGDRAGVNRVGNRDYDQQTCGSEPRCG